MLSDRPWLGLLRSKDRHIIRGAEERISFPQGRDDSPSLPWGLPYFSAKGIKESTVKFEWNRMTLSQRFHAGPVLIPLLRSERFKSAGNFEVFSHWLHVRPFYKFDICKSESIYILQEENKKILLLDVMEIVKTKDLRLDTMLAPFSLVVFLVC